MKIMQRVFPILFILLSFLVLSGCLEYKVVTQIMEDGSIHRTVTVRGDSSLIFEQAFAQFDDPSWDINMGYEPQTEHNDNEDEVFVLEASKMFPDIESLNDEIYSGTYRPDRLNIRASFQKQFKWFYNLYEYSETYLMHFPFRFQPIQEFMTWTELRVYNAEDDDIYYDPVRDSLDVMDDNTVLPVLSREDSTRCNELKDQIEVKYEEWVKRNLFDAFYAELDKAFASLSFVPGAGKQREDFYQWLDSNLVFEDIFEEENVLLDSASGYYSLDSANLLAANRTGFDEFNRKKEGLDTNLDSFSHEVLMPGLVIQSNAEEADGNLVTWNFTTNDFYASDYEMNVQSRVINRRMIVVSAVIIFLIIGILITSLIVKRSKR